jgi:hypothetical protein
MRWIVFRSVFASLLLFGVLHVGIPAVRADGISVQLTNTSHTLGAGSSVSFTGTVTNNSGSDLNASDFFFNFGSFDQNFITPTQSLGTVDFLIPNNSTSSVMDLFSIALASGTPPGQTLPFQFSVLDVFGDQSIEYTGAVQSSGIVATPEPMGFELLLFGLLFLICSKYVSRKVMTST